VGCTACAFRGAGSRSRLLMDDLTSTRHRCRSRCLAHRLQGALSLCRSRIRLTAFRAQSRPRCRDPDPSRRSTRVTHDGRQRLICLPTGGGPAHWRTARGIDHTHQSDRGRTGSAGIVRSFTSTSTHRYSHHHHRDSAAGRNSGGHHSATPRPRNSTYLAHRTSDQDSICDTSLPMDWCRPTQSQTNARDGTHHHMGWWR
jgi:hypothetical protein